MKKDRVGFSAHIDPDLVRAWKIFCVTTGTCSWKNTEKAIKMYMKQEMREKKE